MPKSAKTMSIVRFGVSPIGPRDPTEANCKTLRVLAKTLTSVLENNFSKIPALPLRFVHRTLAVKLECDAQAGQARICGKVSLR